MEIVLDPSKPIYQQIIDEIKRAIARGALKPGDKLPSHREMAQIAKVNPNTVQRAYRELEQTNLVETLRGQGTFVRDDPVLLGEVRKEMAQAALEAFLLEMKALAFGQEEIVQLVAASFKWETQKKGDLS
ncbi:MAG: GntR family transcriptional regulator [Limnochordia bacterium]|jgi:GntR family transcriptional regulator|nr:GntR family transcriptional regulator [Limnochordia bacterium]MDD4518796.1 GntR family transcriptional regulator [Limnochordia bacterium]